MNWAALLVTSLLLSFPFAQKAKADGLDDVQQQFEAGNYSVAMSTLRALVSQDPNNAQQHYWLGRCYYEVRDYKNSVAELEKATQLAPNSSVNHDWLGRAYGAVADQEHSFLLARKVKKEFQTAVQMDPSNIDARRDLQEYLLDAPWIVGGSKEGALEQAEESAKIDAVQGHLAKAEYQTAIGKADLAVEEYNAALSMKPKSIDAYLEVANYYGRLGNGAELTTLVEDARAVSPKDPRLPFYTGVAHIMSGTNFPLAEESLKSYLASSPDRSDWPPHSMARFWLGQLYEKQGNKMAAAEQYREAIGLDSTNKEAEKALSRIAKSLH